ncbi:bola protein [Pavlovales sp. CCMP2436]|nr:bola protein [Pavlovales sp. CCMP2436]|mmetsp:Transcript_15978/g.40786  ORF Transcript_15978/g.40786 Transcript_15978/m.40786 type:complete len:125 (+) Transcript_15978:78-452(+)
MHGGLMRVMSSAAAAAAAPAPGPVAASIAQKLAAALAPLHLEVLNESDGHNVPRGSETHFKVVVVSAAFEGTKLIDRHRVVNSALADELASGVHALSIVAKAPSQWTEGAAVSPSPNCMGGSKR